MVELCPGWNSSSSSLAAPQRYGWRAACAAATPVQLHAHHVGTFSHVCFVSHCSLVYCAALRYAVLSDLSCPAGWSSARRPARTRWRGGTTLTTTWCTTRCWRRPRASSARRRSGRRRSRPSGPAGVRAEPGCGFALLLLLAVTAGCGRVRLGLCRAVRTVLSCAVLKGVIHHVWLLDWSVHLLGLVNCGAAWHACGDSDALM